MAASLVRGAGSRLRRAGFAPVAALLSLLLVVTASWRVGILTPAAEARALREREWARLMVGSARAEAGSYQADIQARFHALLTERWEAVRGGLVAGGVPVFCGGGRRPLVALTFDDGPGPFTREAVSMLKEFGAQATFFIVGRNIDGDRVSHGQRLVRKALGAGALGNHTWTHRSLAGVRARVLQAEIARTKRVLERTSGVPVEMFRSPLGIHDPAVDDMVRSLGMVQVMWSTDSLDSAGATSKEVLARVRDGLRPGAIILLHENRGTTLGVLRKILKRIEREGLYAVSVPTLLALDPPAPAQLRRQTCR